jgi:hypothetical protein
MEWLWSGYYEWVGEAGSAYRGDQGESDMVHGKYGMLDSKSLTNRA